MSEMPDERIFGSTGSAPVCYNGTMARMYPKEVDEKAQSGEKLVYEALRALPNDWVVFHNRDIEYQVGDYHVHYEADFVVLVPKHGILVIEVKDWSFVRLVAGEWQFKGHRPGEGWKRFSKKSPLYQANRAARKLVEGLRNCGILPEVDDICPKIRSMAILTNAVPPNLNETGQADRAISEETHQPFDSLYVCGKAALENGLTERIKTLFHLQWKRGKYMDSAMMQKLTQYLAPSTVLHLDLAAYLEEMEQASAPLFHWLPALADSAGDIRIDGCAGTGKTVMACHEAARLAKQLPQDGEHRVLLLCYNLHLADYLRTRPEIAAQAETITVANFHTFCAELLQASGNGDVLPSDLSGNILTPDVMARLNAILYTLPKYDYIFVDEAQDFHKEWWDILHALCKEEGRLFLFVDEYQDIFHRSDNLPTPAVRLRLRRNLRNTSEIADYTAGMIPEAPIQPLQLHGAPIEIAPANDDPRVRAAHIRSFIERLRRESPIELTNSDIAVLSPWRASRDTNSLPHVGGVDYAPDGETAQQKHERYLRWQNADAPTILGETIKSFKGLEAAYVIVTDIPGETDSHAFGIADLYTACSRAKYGLYLVPTVSGEPLVRRFLAAPASQVQGYVGDISFSMPRNTDDTPLPLDRLFHPHHQP